LSQITSQHTKDSFAAPLIGSDFITGSLPADSFIRPSRIFTADKNIIIRKAGSVKPAVFNTAVQTIIDLLH
jgi:mRNA interferase MazF